MRRFFSAAVIVGSVFAGSSFAGDNCHNQPIQSVTVQRASITVQAVAVPVSQPQQLDSLKKQVDCFTQTCTSDRQKAEQSLAAAKEQVGKSEKAQQLLFKRISFVRDLMNSPCVEVCLNGQTYSKETIATVLGEMLGTFEKGEATHRELVEAQATAELAFNKAAEKEAKWIANQKALTAKVEAIALAAKKRDQQVADAKRVEEARKALSDAFQLADKLTKEAEGVASEPVPAGKPTGIEKPAETNKPSEAAVNQVQTLINNVEQAIAK